VFNKESQINGVFTMKRFCKGVQAVTVELLGVLCVVWMLFGFTAMGLHSVSGQPPALADGLSRKWTAWKEELSTRGLRKAPADSVRQQYVANRLGFFSETYSMAARNHIDELWSAFEPAPAAARTRERYGASHR
jgi:hypothetical protein